jgi:integrase/recombinase XerD
VLALQAWRIEEALGLQVEDLGEEQGHKIAEIDGKGAREDRVPLAAATWSAVQDWLEVAGIQTGPVFVPVLKGGRIVQGKAISKQAAWKRVKQLAHRAGLRHIHPHLFRHGAITAVLDAQVPLREAQDFARHADPRTTRRYDSHRESLNNPAPHVLAARLAARGDGSC